VQVVLSQLFTGISVGSVLLLVALGLVLTFGQMNVINMAHGEFLMAGAYTAYLLQEGLGDPTVSLFLALPAAFAVAGLMGVLLERLLIRRLYRRPLDTLLVTWGVALVLQQLARDLFGAPNKDVAAPEWLAGGVSVLGVTVGAGRLFILVLAGVCVVVLGVALRVTAWGRRVRAVVDNRDLAECSGVSTARVDRLTFLVGSGLAGVAGVALTLLGSIGPTLGTNYVIDAFLVVVVGGIGQIRGAVITAFALGLVQALVEWSTTASIAKVLVFGLIIAFLQVRPQGMFTVRSRSLA
jgi:urea transport system permease protein